FCESKIKLEANWLKRTPEHCVVYSGIITPALEEVTQEAERKTVALMERDDIAIYNAIPTVEGTIMMCIQNTDRTIHGSNVLVVGFGRVGVSTARMFSLLGANVRVAARKPADLARIYEMGMQPVPIHELAAHAEDIDYCINTVPALIVDAAVLSVMPAHTYIVDLASKPGGVDFRYADKRNMRAILAPGLPGIVAPRTAGEMLGKVLVRLIEETDKGVKRI
ncbi:MAG: dipicolinate synthase subunit DpsA, partial [Bacilli bacterium]